MERFEHIEELNRCIEERVERGIKEPEFDFYENLVKSKNIKITVESSDFLRYVFFEEDYMKKDFKVVMVAWINSQLITNSMDVFEEEIFFMNEVLKQKEEEYEADLNERIFK